jgi:hypothetical protein
LLAFPPELLQNRGNWALAPLVASILMEIYSRLALTDAQHTYDTVIDRFPV